jgi:mono/diheme cytochrome c family protein
MMQTYKMQILLTVMALLFFTSYTLGQSKAEPTYKAKCAGCHAADGSGSQVGQKLGTHDFHSSQVQGESEADVEQIIAKGKNKMPGYEKTLKPDEIKALAAYVKELGGKK